MLLSTHMRIHELVMRKSRNDQRLRQLNIQLNDLQRYAEHIADGKISLFEMIKTPASMFNRQLVFNNYSLRYSAHKAEVEVSALTQNPYYNSFIAQNPQYQQYYTDMMRRNFYAEAQKEFAQYERERLHEQEGQIKGEKDCIKVDNEAIKAEIDDLRKERSEEIKQTFSSQA